MVKQLMNTQTRQRIAESLGVHSDSLHQVVHETVTPVIPSVNELEHKIVAGLVDDILKVFMTKLPPMDLAARALADCLALCAVSEDRNGIVLPLQVRLDSLNTRVRETYMRNK